MHSGPLAAVGSLNVTTQHTSFLVTWTAPFSFQFATVGPDLTYCVDVINKYNSSTLQSATLIHSRCSVEETQYSFSPVFMASTCDDLEFRVTPVNQAGNGTSGTISGYSLPPELTVNGMACICSG